MDTWAGGLPQIFGAAAPLTAAGLQFKDFVEIGSGGDRVTFDEAWYFWHGLASDTGDFFFELGAGDGTIANRSGTVSQNSDMTYLDEYGFDIDDQVLRVTAANRNRSSQGNQPAPIINGTPDIPVLVIHTTGDLFVPDRDGPALRQGGHGQRTGRPARRAGHPRHLTLLVHGRGVGTVLPDLFAWVETGTKPAGEDLVADISSPELGCEFTDPDVNADGGSGLRFALPACPP